MRVALKKLGLDEELDLIHHVLDYAGKDKRSSDLFG